MMGPGTEIRYFCPKCFGAELKIHTPVIIDITKANGGRTATCNLCGWEGGSDEVIGALSPETAKFWTSEQVGAVLLTGLAKHAAGPALQLMQLIGIIPKIQGSEEEQASARQVRENVAKALLEGAITAAFQAAGEYAVPHFKRFDSETSELVEKVFSFAPEDLQ